MYMYYYHMYHLYYSSCSIPKYDFAGDFANTLYVIFPQMYVVVTCNCATYLYAFSRICYRNQIRVNIKLFVAAQLILKS